MGFYPSFSLSAPVGLLVWFFHRLYCRLYSSKWSEPANKRLFFFSHLRAEHLTWSRLHSAFHLTFIRSNQRHRQQNSALLWTSQNSWKFNWIDGNDKPNQNEIQQRTHETHTHKWKMRNELLSNQNKLLRFILFMRYLTGMPVSLTGYGYINSIWDNVA